MKILKIKSKETISIKDSNLPSLFKLKSNIIKLKSKQVEEIQIKDLKLNSSKLLTLLTTIGNLQDELDSSLLLKASLENEMSKLIGQKCPYCGRVIDNLEDLCQ